MQKTRLGISVGLMGTIFFAVCFFGGYVPMIIIAGYILLAEDNIWLKKSAVKGIVLVVAFAIVSTVINLIPDFMILINSVFNVFGKSFYINAVSGIVNVINNIINIAEKILFVLLGLKALNQGTVRIPVLESFVNKYMGN